MPFFPVEIKKKRYYKSILLFLVLTSLYISGFLVVGWILKLYISFFSMGEGFVFSSVFYLSILFLAVFIVLIQWIFSYTCGVQRILKILKAKDPEPLDKYHKQFINIIDEIKIASGNPYLRGVVVPSPSVNAFSIATNRRNGVIGVTEGILSKLTRSQLEAVVAHEVSHLLNNDVFIVTLSCSMFATYAQSLRAAMEGTKETRRGEIAFVALIIGFFAVIAKLLNTCISRQREYMADATAIQLTRNPQSLAEALIRIRFCWRGIGAIDESMSPIFIDNPAIDSWEEEEKWYSKLFTTHPPFDKRLKVISEIAQIPPHVLIENVSAQKKNREEARMEVNTEAGEKQGWMVQDNEEWKGPFTISEMLALPGFDLKNNIYHTQENNIHPASEEPALKPYLEKKNSQSLTTRYCPRCLRSLDQTFYEGTPVQYCKLCTGFLIPDDSISRILSRRESSFSEEFLKKADKMRINLMRKNIKGEKINQRDKSPMIRCPLCNALLGRMYYSYQYQIIIDRCFHCQQIWFDKEELYYLQAMVENQTGNQ